MSHDRSIRDVARLLATADGRQLFKASLDEETRRQLLLQLVTVDDLKFFLHSVPRSVGDFMELRHAIDLAMYESFYDPKFKRRRLLSALSDEELRECYRRVQLHGIVPRGEALGEAALAQVTREFRRRSLNRANGIREEAP